MPYKSEVNKKNTQQYFPKFVFSEIAQTSKIPLKNVKILNIKYSQAK